MRSWNRDHEASVLDERAREIEADSKQLFVEIGLLCCEMEDRNLFENLIDVETRQPLYESFNQWLHAAMPTQHSTAYAARNALRALKDIIPESDLHEIPRCNLETLGKCSTAIAKDPEFWQAAKELSQNEFVREISGRHPEQHLEERDPYRFAPTKNQREVIDAAISAVRVIMGDEALSREECLWHVARTFMEDHEDLLKEKIAEHNGQGHCSAVVR